MYYLSLIFYDSQFFTTGVIKTVISTLWDSLYLAALIFNVTIKEAADFFTKYICGPQP